MNSFSGTDIQDLVTVAQTARQMAYCPYSQFKVGAALLCDNNKVFTGCNVENSSYGGSICAERTAVVKAVSEGNKSFKSIVVSTESPDFVSPCGYCRQFLVEFGSDTDVYLVPLDSREVMVTNISELLPLHFHLRNHKVNENINLSSSL